MAYQAGKTLLLRLLKVPPQPAAPYGSPGSVRVFLASKRYLAYRTLGWALAQAWLVVAALVGIAVLAFAPIPGPASLVVGVLELIGLATIVLGMVISYLVMRLDYEMRWYVVTDRSLRIREGIWEVHEMTMTFANIQNLSITQGPIQRLFGIANLKVQSAGGGGVETANAQKHGMRDLHVGWFRGVDDAASIRDLIADRLRRLRDAGLGDHDDRHVADPGALAGPHGQDIAPALVALRDEMAGLRAAAERLASPHS
jgi:membrane protein YdbS with pleckstrin-like domain